MNRPITNLIVSCSNRKTRAVPASRRLGCLPAGDAGTRSQAWLQYLTAPLGERVKALSLYAGDHWSVAKSCLSSLSGAWATDLWVCSAGYGLIPADAPIAAYSATFSSGQADSVSVRRSTAYLQQWWHEIALWEGPQPGSPRSLESLAAQSPSRPFIVAASVEYLYAMEQDLLRARSRLETPDLLLIISPRMPAASPLSVNLLPVNASFQGIVGGSLGSLNVRVARSLLERFGEGELRYSRVADELAGLLVQSNSFSQPARTPCKDEEVAAFITQELTAQPGLSRSSLLAALRASGRACEQSRFAGIYRREVEGWER